MDAMSNETLDLDAWMRSAYRGEAPCPPPEVFLPSEWEELADEERRRLEEHLAGCPACAAERDLARAFEPDAEELAAHHDEIAAITARLREVSPVRARAEPAGGKVLPWRAADDSAAPAAKRRVSRQRWLGLAAAAVLALVVGFGIVAPRQADRLDAPPTAGSTLRSATVRAIAPEGTVARRPGGFEWSAVANASAYRVRLLDVRGDVLFETTVPGTRAALSPEAAAALSPRVTYRWRVEAMDAEGGRLAASPAVEFRFEEPAG